MKMAHDIKGERITEKGGAIKALETGGVSTGREARCQGEAAVKGNEGKGGRGVRVKTWLGTNCKKQGCLRT